MDERNDAIGSFSTRSAGRHWGGFLVSGLIALSVDATVLEIGVRLLALGPLLARLIAISCAMVVGWLAHRTLTFALRSPPSLNEFARYAAVAWTTAAINYGVFASIILVRPATLPFVALIAASIVATVFAYLGMRYGAFRGKR
ncbi:MAG TPA: GtrA family protein [Hyphomicrobiaceae bacterium]|nr:GtrA family protein [Hyphomicrobiaceae bacterium]